MKKEYILVLVILLSTIAGCLGGEVKGNAPDFTLITIDGETFTLSDYRGKVILIDFMATWCAPCKTEMNELNKVYEEVGNDVIIISIASISDSEQGIRTTFGKYVDKWIFAIDTAEENVGGQYNIRYIPTIYIIDANGDISYTHTGVTGKDELMQEIEKASG